MTVTSERIAAIRARNTHHEPPPCRICGRALSIASMGGGQPTTWACNGLEDDPENPSKLKHAEGRPHADRDEEWKHYGDSRWIAPTTPSSDTLYLLDELAAAQARITSLERQLWATAE